MSTLYFVSPAALNVMYSINIFKKATGKIDRDHAVFGVGDPDDGKVMSRITVATKCRNSGWMFPGCRFLTNPFDCVWYYQYMLAPHCAKDIQLLGRTSIIESRDSFFRTIFDFRAGIDVSNTMSFKMRIFE